MSIFLLKVFKRLARIGLPALLILTLFLTSSCALLLLGAGGLGGYMIRKGEDGGSAKSSESSRESRVRSTY